MFWKVRFYDPKFNSKSFGNVHSIRKVNFLLQKFNFEKFSFFENNFFGKSKLLTSKKRKTAMFSWFFYPKYFRYFFSGKQSCQHGHLKSAKPYHFHEFFPLKDCQFFLGKSKFSYWIKKWRVRTVFLNKVLWKCTKSALGNVSTPLIIWIINLTSFWTFF